MGLLDAFIQYAKDAMPGGLLNAETQPVVDRAKYIGGLLDPNSQVSQDARNWHGKVQTGLKDQLAGLQTPAADYAHQQMMNMAGIAPLGMIAWHGSPHKFDKFSLDKIGTGEGAQAYGHGLYLAESPEVAKQYAKELGTTISYDGKPLLKANKTYKTGNDLLDTDLIAELGNTAAVRAQKLDAIKELRQMESGHPAIKQYQQELAELRNVRGKVSVNTDSQLYKTDIPDEAVARFLDWDKPLSQQAPEVLDAIKKSSAKYGPVRGNSPIYSDAAAPYMTGHDFYRDLANALSDGGVRRGSTALSGQDAIASKHLQDLGVHGIRYLDGGSRSAGNGTSNFVAFDPEMIRILERNGQPTGLQPWKPGEYKGILAP